MTEKEYSTKWRMAAHQPLRFSSRVRNSFRHIAFSILAIIDNKCEDKFLRALFTHYVFDDQKEQFEKLIIRLKQLGTFINTETCIQMLEGRREIDKGYFHLSFDDGFRNVYNNAFPILQMQSIPALFFIPSSWIDANWEQARSYCLIKTEYRGVIEMSRWSDLRDMVSHGFEIGSHSKTHTRLSYISKNNDILQDEIRGSKMEIEDRLGRECKYIAWPFGWQKAIDEYSIETIRNVGYHACFGGYRGTIIPNVTDKYRIPRHYFETQWPVNHIKYFANGNWESP